MTDFKFFTRAKIQGFSDFADKKCSFMPSGIGYYPDKQRPPMSATHNWSTTWRLGIGWLILMKLKLPALRTSQSSGHIFLTAQDFFADDESSSCDLKNMQVVDLFRFAIINIWDKAPIILTSDTGHICDCK